MPACIYACMFACLYVKGCVCMHACMCVQSHVVMYHCATETDLRAVWFASIILRPPKKPIT